jgi:HEAT repeat protein
MQDSKRLVDAVVVSKWRSFGTIARQLAELSEDPVPTLIASASHSDQNRRAVAIALMDHLADDRCLPALRKGLRSSSSRVRRHAVHSLGCQQCKGSRLRVDVAGLLIASAESDSSIRVRRVAVHQLGLQPPDERIVVSLQRMMITETDSGFLRRAQHALTRQQREL